MFFVSDFCFLMRLRNFLFFDYFFFTKPFFTIIKLQSLGEKNIKNKLN